MIAVTGATGHLGQLIINHLLKKTSAKEITALVRNPAKAENLKSLGITVREANYDNAASWDTALSGVDKLILVSSSEVGKRATQHLTVIKAAQKAKVGQLIYTSLLRADTSKLALATEHVATEKALKDSGLNYTILRNGWYIENHTENLAPAIEHGALIGAAGEGLFSSAARNDYAEAAAVVATTAGHDKKTYELAGDNAYNLAQLVAALSKKIGKPIIYKNLSQDDYQKALEQVGLPAGFAFILADSDAWAAQGELASDDKTLSRLIGRPTTQLNALL